MKCAAACLWGLVGIAAGAGSHEAGDNPIEKVLVLLKDLKDRMAEDEKKEKMVYDKFACFCDNALKGKADSIDHATATMRSSGQQILKLRGQIATLDSEISELADSIADNEKMQRDKTSIRGKENTEYMAETTEMKEALAALEQAVTVLRKATESAFLQEGASKKTAAVTAVLERLPSKATLSPKQVSLLATFARAGAGAKYAPQSDTVQGILRDMYDTFGSDLESATETEAIANRDFESLIATLTKELKDLKETKQNKEKEKADAEASLADETSLYDKTEAQKKADIKYFDATKDSCEAKWEEWDKRSSLRAEEMEGVQEALNILNDDDNRALFGKTIKAGKETGAASFLQTSSHESVSGLVASAYRALKDQASAAHSLRLAHLALRVREAKVGHFDEVIASIDKMMKALKEEGAADKEKRDQCKEEYQKIASKSADLKWKIKNNNAKIDKLEKIIAKREEEKAQTIEDIETTKQQIKDMEKERKAEHEEYKKSKSEDEQAVDLLTQAKAKLSAFYKKNGVDMGNLQNDRKISSLVAREPEFEVDKYQAPEAEFSDKGSRKGESKGIVSLMTMVIEDLGDEIKNAMKDEVKAQLSYEKARKAAEEMQAELEAKKESLETAIAERTEEKGEEKKTLEFNEGELKDEVEYKESITADCDWIISAFEKRAKARTSEMEGLTSAKEYLAGANNAAFLQSGTSSPERFDDSALSKVRFLGIQR